MSLGLGTGQVAPIVTRGMGTKNVMITQGFSVAVVVVVAKRIKRRIKGKTKKRKEYGDYYDEYKISAFLVEFNGKEITQPIISNVSKLYEVSKMVSVKAKPTRLRYQKSDDVKVWVTKVKIRRNDDDTD